MPKPIIGRHVTLRKPTSHDQVEYLALNRHSRAFYRNRHSPPYSSRDFQRWLARASDPDHQFWFIIRHSDLSIVGTVELTQIVRGRFLSAYLGYAIGAPHAHQGFMREALTLALTHAFRRLKLHRVEANIQPDNYASIRLVKRLGFRREGYSPKYLKIAGRWRDHERWAILASEWKSRGPSGRKGAA